MKRTPLRRNVPLRAQTWLRRKVPLRTRSALRRRVGLSRRRGPVELTCDYCGTIFHRFQGPGDAGSAHSAADTALVSIAGSSVSRIRKRPRRNIQRPGGAICGPTSEPGTASAVSSVESLSASWYANSESTTSTRGKRSNARSKCISSSARRPSSVSAHGATGEKRAALKQRGLREMPSAFNST